jgi:hypothetical protein
MLSSVSWLADRQVLKFLRRGSNWKAALVAVCLLVIQSIGTSLALGAAASDVRLDAFGNVICTAQGGETPHDGNIPAGHMPACCVAGCGVGTPVLPPPATASSPVAISFNVLPVPPSLDMGNEFAHPRSPANPRAPPLII